MQHGPRRLLPAIVALALLAPSAAFGQSGVTFDDGPSSKEYAIPLDAARGATKTKAPTPKVQAPAPATTTPVPATPTATTASKPKPSRKKSATKTTESAAPVVTTPQPPNVTPTRVATPASSSSQGMGAGIVIGGLALAAIVLGGLAGLVLRRRHRPIDEY